VKSRETEVRRPNHMNVPVKARSSRAADPGYPSVATELEQLNIGQEKVWEVPASANSRYLSHDYFRYIGKFPPQIAHRLIVEFSKPGDLVLDPMCGGGTVLIESKLLGRRAVGCDINPVALIVARVSTRSIHPAKLEKALGSVRESLSQLISPGELFSQGQTWRRRFDFAGCEHFFDGETLDNLDRIRQYLDELDDIEVREFLLLAVLSTLRKVSLANVKKMNVVVDPHKQRAQLFPTLFKKLEEMEKVNRELDRLFSRCSITVMERDALEPPKEKHFASLAIVHPPYISNTAFSESTQLQLGFLGIRHTSIWKKELRVRGSYVHEPDGLRKYLVGWHRILANMFEALKPGGFCVLIVGDGRIDFVRIPMRAITAEFCKDIGFCEEAAFLHRLNNNTGWTLTHKMREQHVVVFRKPTR